MPDHVLVSFLKKFDWYPFCVRSNQEEYRIGEGEPEFTVNFKRPVSLQALMTSTSLALGALRCQEKYGEYDSEFSRIAQGRQMLLELNLSDFDYIQLLEGLFQGEITYVGYPMEDGKVGSSFAVYGGMAMTSGCRDKEGAWQFMREVLLPRSRENEYFYPGFFPVNKEDFMAVVEQAMERDYLVDENGENILDEVVIQIVDEEVPMFFHGDKTAEQVAEIIQNRVSLYVSEQK